MKKPDSVEIDVGPAPAPWEGAKMPQENDSTQAEEWREVSGTDGRYIVSSLGTVRRTKPRKGLVEMRAHLTQDGYPRIKLCLGPGVQKKRTVHWMVATAFIGPVADGMEVNHKNGIKVDCRLENLEIVTDNYNQWHATHVLGKRQHIRGSVHGMSKLSEEDIPIIRQLHSEGANFTAIGLRFNVAPQTVCGIIKGRSWTHVQ